ncbi:MULTISPECIES: GNAT family N-acetyltransferase [unclassified Erysipelothrix]|uniref:GNAT family N-acetyltransferase n=1 Tax=unclassified Erysipelothrix TaxID=2624170 RepID=UPI0013781A39|nr:MULTISPECIES: GNAT family N-acetyltransferase [unclassified Erysipelothrix]MBK2402896.1 GNAT family N-acetyltransferase [Erysipelothrix sp. strain 2 (EsS2-6-Brazil)]MBK2404808.1 GNAT family N-acetyltransferase [Erysipelothrix sp. strain 2 (EsS2-7-Brazil)]NBA01933.1 GNAT family N-acetyltransferase [Erysipelothrix rhusiopathiae]
MELRSFTDSDLPLYVELATKFLTSPACFGEPDFELFTRNFKHIIKENDCFGWFLVEDGKVCGYLLSSIMFSTEVGGLQLWVEELSVEDAYRGQGLGTEALSILMDAFPDVVRFRLEVTPSNKGAKKLYERLGFEFLGYEQMILDR